MSPSMQSFPECFPKLVNIIVQLQDTVKVKTTVVTQFCLARMLKLTLALFAILCCVIIGGNLGLTHYLE